MYEAVSKAGPLPYALTLEVRDTCLGLHAKRAARALARRYDEALRPLSISSGQFSLLMSLNRAEPPKIGDIADLLAMDRTTLSANMKPLQRRGLLKVSVDREDGRSRRMTLTAAGRKLLAAAVPLWRRVQAENESRVPGSDSERLRADLRALS